MFIHIVITSYRLKMNYLSLYYCIHQRPSLPLGWVVKLTPIRQLSSSLVLNLYQTNATDIIWIIRNICIAKLCGALWFMGHGFESENRLFSHHGASAFSKLRSLAKCSLDDSVRRLL